MTIGRMPLRWAMHRLGIVEAYSSTTQHERDLLAKWSAGRRLLVEIGADEGVNSLNLRKSMHEAGVLYLVDPYRGGRLKLNFSYLIARREIAKCPRGEAVFVRQYSRQAADELNIDIEFAFIDGDHAYEAVLFDWRFWTRKVVRGGVVALHDSRLFDGGWTTLETGPVRLVHEIQAGEHGRSFELVDAVDSLSVFQRRTAGA